MGVDVAVFADHALTRAQLLGLDVVLQTSPALAKVGAEGLAEWAYETRPEAVRLGEEPAILACGVRYQIMMTPQVLVHKPMCRWVAFSRDPSVREHVVSMVRRIAAAAGATELVWAPDVVSQPELEAVCRGAKLEFVVASLRERLGTASSLDDELAASEPFPVWGHERISQRAYR